MNQLFEYPGGSCLKRGMLLALPEGRGVGKLEGMNGDVCDVSVFYSIVRSETFSYPAKSLAKAYLSPQTRVYALDEDRYRVGRISNFLTGDHGLVTYEVRFPNGKIRDFSETDLFLRPWNAPDDPAEVLAGGGAESQFLHDARLHARQTLIELRGAARGMTALLSADVELVPHQVAAVRRILSDPVQRYLLADEVGLGKTIEAGLVIRQRLIDDPQTEVLIAVPRHLISQWQSELNGKMRLSQFGGRFEVCAHEDLVRVHSTPDLLVVDEVHHLVGTSQGALAHAATQLGDLSQRVASLLLLSATPVLSDDERFLALLNMLDPIAHPIGDIEGFRRKLEQRQTLGRVLLSLDPQGPGLVLRQRATELAGLFPDDTVVQTLSAQLIEASKAKSTNVGTVATALRQHVADSYRIHQRLIRSRRADAMGWEFRPRGPSFGENAPPSMPHVREEVIDDPTMANLLSGLEDWRTAANTAVGRGVADEAILAARYVSLLEATGISCAALNNALQTEPPFQGEADIRADLIRLTKDSSCDAESLRIVAMSIQRLRDNLVREIGTPKIVVFSSSPERAQGIAALVPDAVLLNADADKVQANSGFARFAAPDGPSVLILNREGEEGLNLSFSDAIVHLDLPFSTARVEQRIGRLDRFGRTKDVIRHRILLPSDDEASPWAAWQRLLSEGMLIYHSSISDVQFLLEEIEATLARTILRQGAVGIEAMISEVRSRITTERRAQHEQSALDRIALAEHSAEALIDAINDVEADEDEIETAVETWAVRTLQIRKQSCARETRDPFFWKPEQTTLIPKHPWREVFKLFEDEPLTWRRRIAMRRPHVTLLRPGMPLIDVLERFTRWDDRGSAFATWRQHAEWTGENWMGFRICLLSEPGLVEDNLLRPDQRQLAIARRAQQYLRPNHVMLHIDASGEPVADAKLNGILELPYTNKKDTGRPWIDVNLGSRPEVFSGIIDPGHFAEICRSVRDSAVDTLLNSGSFHNECSQAVTAARSDVERRRARLARRALPGGSIEDEIAFAEEVLAAVSRPSVRLDAIGFFFVSGLNA
jgi:ATP-dependent helicase HepA